MKYHNPIITGFHPDPSVCRVGNDFYLVNSSFEYFPGIPIYHSTDLTHWEQIGHVLDRKNQLKLVSGAPNCLGIYAPTIRYHEGIFYCIVTNVGGRSGGNFFVYTTDPYGRWSNPVKLPFAGIDPSLFFDEDGRIYYTGTDTGIYIAEITFDVVRNDTPKRNELPVSIQNVKCGEKHYIWNGSGGNNPEGPHLYRIHDMYYLMIAEGGTEYCHMVTIARSKNVYGPYEACPHNPVLSNRSTCLNIKAIGHADLVEDSQGSWWAVCLGIRPLGYPFRHNLGRETMLAPVKWENGWPVMGDNGTVTETFEVETAPGKKTRKSDFYIPGSNMTDTFCSNKLHPSWNTIYTPVSKFVKPTKQGLSLCAYDTTLSDDKPKAILVRRQEHFHFTATATLTLESVNAGSEAGITIYMNNRHHYEAALSTVGNGEYFLILRRCIGSLQAVEARIPFHCNTVQFILTGDKNHYTFSYLDVKPDENPMPASAAFPGAVDAPVFIGEGEAQYLTTEVGGCFTGNYIGLYASKGEALFTEFSYQGGRS